MLQSQNVNDDDDDDDDNVSSCDHVKNLFGRLVRLASQSRISFSPQIQLLAGKVTMVTNCLSMLWYNAQRNTRTLHSISGIVKKERALNGRPTQGDQSQGMVAVASPWNEWERAITKELAPGKSHRDKSHVVSTRGDWSRGQSLLGFGW